MTTPPLSAQGKRRVKSREVKDEQLLRWLTDMHEFMERQGRVRVCAQIVAIAKRLSELSEREPRAS